MLTFLPQIKVKIILPVSGVKPIQSINQSLLFLGHYCTLGSEESGPINQPYGDYCPAGFYCPDGTYDPVPCPSGTFLNETGKGHVDDCLHCSPGFYCEPTGKTNVTDMCDAGYYCTIRANISAPTDGTTGKFFSFMINV